MSSNRPKQLTEEEKKEERLSIAGGVFKLIEDLKGLPSTVAQIVAAIQSTPTVDILAVRSDRFMTDAFLVSAARGGLEPEIAIAVTSFPPANKQQEYYAKRCERMLYFTREIKKRTGVSFPDSWNAGSAYFMITRLLNQKQLNDLGIEPYQRKDRNAVSVFEVLASKAAPQYKTPAHEFFEWAMTVAPREEQNVNSQDVVVTAAESKEIDVFSLAGDVNSSDEVESVGKQVATEPATPTTEVVAPAKSKTKSTKKKATSAKKSAGASASAK